MGNIDRDSFSEVAWAVGVQVSGTWCSLLPEVGSISSQPGAAPGLPGQEMCRGPSKAFSLAEAPCTQARGQQGLRTSSGAPEGSGLPGGGWGWVVSWWE